MGEHDDTGIKQLEIFLNPQRIKKSLSVKCTFAEAANSEIDIHYPSRV